MPSPSPSSPSPVITVTEVGAPGEPGRTHPVTSEEHRDIVEQLILGLLDEGVDVSEWMGD
jgi:hypothetical protein